MEGRRPALSCVAARVPRRKVSVQKVEKTLICLGIALVVGLLMSRLAKLVHLPAVTAYLVGGLLIGPFCLGALNIPYIGFNSLKQVEGLSVITQTALGFIAFAIGNEFRVSQLKTMGKQAITVGILQAVITTIVVDIAHNSPHCPASHQSRPPFAAFCHHPRRHRRGYGPGGYAHGRAPV